MKLIKLVTCAAFLAAGAMLGAEVTFHGYLDYTNFGVGQKFTKTGDADFVNSEASAEYGNASNGLTQIDMNVSAASMVFNFGIRLNSSMGNWTTKYYDVESGTATPFYQGNMRVGFLNDQILLYTGKFEDWNAGYISDGYVFKDQNISNLADSTVGQHITAVEVTPYAVKGLRFIAGLPILPVNGNGVSTSAEYNKWVNLYKKVMFEAGYAVQNDMGLSFTAGFRPGTYYTGVYEGGSVKSDWITNYYAEGFVQANMLKLIPGVELNASYDIRYRDDASFTDVYGNTVTHFAMAHMFGVSGQIKPMDALSVAVENRFFYAGDDYTKSDEKFIYNIFGAEAAYKISGTQYEVGLGADFIYAQDALGSAFTGDSVDSDYFDDISLTVDSMNCASLPAKGTAGKYMTFYINPYIQRNFASGYARLGIEAEYSRFETSTVNQAISYRVPVGLIFKF